MAALAFPGTPEATPGFTMRAIVSLGSGFLAGRLTAILAYKLIGKDFGDPTSDIEDGVDVDSVEENN